MDQIETASEDFFRSIIQNCYDLVVRFDKLGRFLYASPHVLKLLDIDASEISGKRLRQLEVEHPLLSDVEAMLHSVIDSGLARTEIFEINTLEDRLVYELRLFPERDEEGQIASVAGIALDVSKYRSYPEMKRSRNVGQEKLERALHQAGGSIGYCVTNPQMEWLEINEAFIQMLGYGEEVLRSMSWIELTHPEDLASDLENLNKILTGKIDSYHLEKRFIGGSGQELFTFVLCFCRRKPNRTVESLSYWIVDVSEGKRQEMCRQKLDSIHDMAQLAGGVAHDFNNILMGLFGNLELALMNLDGKSPAYLYLERALHVLERANNLSGDLSEFAKTEIPKRRVVDLAAMAGEVSAVSVGTKDIEVHIERSADLFSCRADDIQMRRLFFHLIGYAVYAMPKGGNITISFQNAAMKDLKLFHLSGGDYVMIQFKDESESLDANTLKNIFEPYSNQKKTGSGLALTEVYGIVGRHDGYIRADSSDQGTTFTLLLPAAKNNAIDSGGLHRNGKILVMDDDPVILDLLVRVLNDAGYKADTADTAQQVLNKYRTELAQGDAYDAVILDLNKSGKDVVKEIRSLDHEARCIVSSGYANDPVLKNYQDFGFMGTVVKPYSSDRLKDVLLRVLKT